VLIFLLLLLRNCDAEFLVQNTKVRKFWRLQLLRRLSRRHRDALTMILVMAVMLRSIFWEWEFSVDCVAQAEAPRWQRRRRGLMKGTPKFRAMAVVAMVCAAFAGCKSSADAGRGREADNTADHEHGCGDTAADCHGCAATGKNGWIRRQGCVRSRGEDGLVRAAACRRRQAIAQTQDYILSQLQTFGCTVETDAFTASTPVGPCR